MKPTLVADEMFPEGAGPYVELDEVIYESYVCIYCFGNRSGRSVNTKCQWLTTMSRVLHQR